jgi:uncharacterized protein (TIGR02679 family)
VTTEAHLPPWVRNPELEVCWARVRSRFEASGLVAQGRTIVELSTREERHAVGELLGRALTRDRVMVDLAELDDRLRQRSGAGGLADLLPVVTGAPLLDRPADRAEQTARREAPLELARTLVVEPWVEDWVAGLRATGLLTNREDASLVVQQAAAVLSALAAVGPVGPGSARSRVELAAQVVGDAHALDEDRVLTQVVLRGLAAASGCAVPSTHAERRALWEAYAVAPDLLSRTCLTLGLRPTSDDPVARRLQLAAAAGDPMHLTGWDLRRLAGGWQPEPGGVLVCENPRVLEAIAENYAGNHAVVCTSGEPNTVVTALLQRLVDAGRPLRYHGDFDWPGIAIANRVHSRFGAVPWRMNAVDYERAARADGPALQGTAVEPCWDAELGAGMRALGRAVHEESVLPDLLDALVERA